MKENTIKSILEDTNLTPQNKVDKLKTLAMSAIGEAEVLCQEYDCNLSFELTYGAGASYEKGWNSSSCYGENDEYEWQASSQSC